MHPYVDSPSGARKVRPDPSAGRIADVDALRGMALLGILVVNVAFFASGYPFHLVVDPQHGSWPDRTVSWLIEALVTMKAYLLFSFLFGYSFTLQIGSARRRGVEFAPRFRRRLAGLFMIGVLHAVLLFQGDILTTYALLGLVLLALSRTSTRVALVTAAAALGAVAFAVAIAAVAGAQLVPDQAAALAAGARSTEALRGGPGEVIAEHLRSLPAMVSALVVQGPLAFSAFLVGLAAGDRQVLVDAGRHDHVLRRVQWVGFPVGLAGSVVFAAGGGTRNFTGLLVSILTAPLLTAAYAATALRFFRTRRGRRLAAALAPAGRMSLTNYLGQSVLCVVIFTGVGLRLAGTVGASAVVLIALGIYAAQVFASAVWMARFRYGPVEWLLRMWTERRRIPLRPATNR
ncbi:DUF418 domain-containing protein [Frankia nepalensis]|uniref:DUF418 domain-containing protein n=1 Tax=Frankia nepalensis TaxID=1836974 RepID=A0A937REH8_9ACTN|nr:DUF418 domain-containing protein [Frankia nepalensis]MBL7628940.1 DUF418 domain-containing protein [Frankia nepalensis]